MTAILIVVITGLVYVVASLDVREQKKNGKGFINFGESKTLAGYFLSSGIQAISYPTLLASIVCFALILSLFVHLKTDIWYISAATFFVLYKIGIQFIIKFSFAMKSQVNQLTPNILDLISTAYAASSQDVGKAVKVALVSVRSEAIKRPLLDFIDGIEKKEDPVKLSAIAKLHYRSPIMRDLIDAITEEKVQGGLFSERLKQLFDEAQRMNDVEMQTKSATIDSSIAAYFISLLTLVASVSAVVWNPSILDAFKATPLGNALMISTVLMIGYNIVLADSKSRIGE